MNILRCARTHNDGPRAVLISQNFLLEEMQHVRVLWLHDKSGVYTCAVIKSDWHCSDRASIVPVVGARTMPVIETCALGMNP